MRVCGKCKQERDESEFGAKADTSAGVNLYCRICQRAATQACRERIREIQVEQAASRYLARHTERRRREAEIEASLLSFDPQPEPCEVFAASSLPGIINGMLRPKTKEFGWAIR